MLTNLVPPPSHTVCSNGKVHTDCGTACPVTCANKDSPPLICPLVCVIGCVCPQGMAEHEDGCLALEECPTSELCIIILCVCVCILCLYCLIYYTCIICMYIYWVKVCVCICVPNAFVCYILRNHVHVLYWVILLLLFPYNC